MKEVEVQQEQEEEQESVCARLPVCPLQLLTIRTALTVPRLRLRKYAIMASSRSSTGKPLT